MKNIKKQSKNYQNGWVKVAGLSAGDKIAVPKGQTLKTRELSRSDLDNSNDILWDEIVSIKPIGRERVYDIEIEDTHNFVGNGIFAHNTYIGGNVGIGVTTPTAKLHVNDLEEAAFVVTSAGRVGVGTTTPAYKMSVVGDIAATAFVNISTKDSKIDIQYLTDEEEASVLDKIKNTNVATYHYNLEDPANPKRLGLIAEQAPAEVLSIDGKGVDIYKLSTFTLAGLKALDIKVDDLATRVTNLEAQSNPTLPPLIVRGGEEGLSSRLIAVAKSTLASLASTIGDWANAVLAGSTRLTQINADQNADYAEFKTYSLQGSREEIVAAGSATLTMLPADPQTGMASAGVKIKFDESFVSVISETEPIKVILTPTTRLNGSLYVAQKSRFGFEVREINAQDEGGMFDWMVIAGKKSQTDAEESAAPISPISPIVPIEEPPAEEPAPAEEVTPTAEAPADEPAPVVEEPAPTVEEVVPPAEDQITPLPTETPPAEEVTPPAEEVTPPAEEPLPPPSEEPITTP